MQLFVTTASLIGFDTNRFGEAVMLQLNRKLWAINRHPRTQNFGRSAFTLIELLVVIAIISLLAAFLFPTFSRARENGRKAACMNNMKQLALGFAQYTADYEGRYPGAAQFQKWANGGHWVAGSSNQTMRLNAPDAAGNPAGTLTSVTIVPDKGAIYPYVKNTQVYHCPSSMDGEFSGLTYTMNCAISGVKENSITQSSSVILLDDEKLNNDGYFYADDKVGSTDQMTDIHNGGGNLAFCDGHVKYYPFAVFPVSKTTVGQALKVRTTGAPRFYDLGIGPKGFNENSKTKSAWGTCEEPAAP
ncbi:MAG TPA: DUF1559 domain-containing protein [Abditibacteriaceae bacterium]